MKTLFGFGTLTALAMAAVACNAPYEEKGPSSSSLEVTGTVDTALRTLDNASAVAIGSDGRTYSAYLKRSGSFKLDLPVGHVYRIIIANSTMNGELRTIGHLVNNTSDGKADEIAVKEGGKMNLGALRPVGAPSTSGVRTACDCDESGGGKVSEKPEADEGDWDNGGKGDTSGKGEPSDKGDDDYKSKPKDSDKDRLCEGDADVELEAQNKPGDKCKKDSKDKPAPKPTKKSCSTKDDDKDGKDDGSKTEKPGPAPEKDGSGSGSGSEKDEGGYGGKPAPDKSAPSGDSCTCSLECGKGSSCFASKCVADDAPVSKK
jgi:hypothetical protein